MRILSLLVLGLFFLFFNQQPKSPHGKDFKVSCSTCHSAKGWQVDKSVYSFNHDKTKFVLTGQHTAVNCRQCHSSLIFTEAKRECNECHKDVHEATTGLDCSRCHTPDSWLVNNITEIHQTSRFPLLGAHRSADCSDCHKSQTLVRFDVPGVECIDCHREEYMATTHPNHVKAAMSEDCSICHPINAFQWSEGGFNHNFFPLAQGHSAVKCAECHTSGTFTGLNPDCYSCHQKDFIATTSPNHASSNFPTTCSNCHTLASRWKPAAFDHSSFPLTLGHSIPNCIDCHTGGNYSPLPTDCYSCHQQDFISSTNPNHVASQFSTACLTCHTINPGWKPTTFDHGSFPLTLGHSTPACIDCHKGGNYTTTPTDCYACHQQDFTTSTNPNHVASGFSNVCLTCHTVNPGWKPTTFNHSGFPLTLGHSTPTCVDCHKGGNYTTTPTDCYACHQQDFTASTNPNHTSSGFSQVCTQCHTTNPGWKPTTFNHTGFPLTLGHAGRACTDCHAGGNYTSTPTDCYACHQQDFTASTNPNHTASGFSHVCTQCHTTNPGWKPTTFNHSAFPLTLGHAGRACTDCHIGGNYTSTPTDCYACHQQDFTTTTNPNHTASGFSHVCTQCHTTNPGWKPTTFNHSSFPLTLGHAGRACTDCHIGGNYTSTPTDCFSCHQTDYNNSINPNHKTLAFSSTCTQCHTTNPGWQPATYTQHDSQFFPIYSGRHQGQWNTCAECHTNASNYAQFNCINCHQNAHSGKNYTNAQCYECHPRGTNN